MAYSPDKVTIEIEAIVDHVQELQHRSDRLAAIMQRASRGLDFSLSQQELTKGFPNSEYWTGKVDAYTALLETGFGLTSDEN
jgi:hypothetical protein